MDWWRQVHGDMSHNTYKVVDENYGFLLKLSAVNDFKAHRTTFYAFYSLAAFASIIYLVMCFLMTGLHSTHEIYAFVKNFHVASAAIVAIAIVVECKRHTVEFVKFHSIAGEGFFNYEQYIPGVEEIINRGEINKLRWKNYFPLLLLSLYVLLTIANPFANRISSPSVNNGCNINMLLPVAMWTPYDSSSGFAFILTYIFQNVIIAYILSVFATTVVLFATISEDICCQLSVLQLAFKSLEYRALTYSDKSGEIVNYWEAFDFCLRNNIKHHTVVIKCWTYFSECVSGIVFLVSLVSGITLAADVMATFAVKTGLLTLIRTFLFVVTEVSILWCICWYGEKINALGNGINRELYNLGWSSWPKDAKRAAAIIFEFSKKPLMLQAGRLIPAKLKTFSSILKAVYAYTLTMNILVALVEKKNQ